MTALRFALLPFLRASTAIPFCNLDCFNLCKSHSGDNAVRCCEKCGCFGSASGDCVVLLEKIIFPQCDTECKDICKRSGGGKACCSACQCDDSDCGLQLAESFPQCDAECKETCKRSGGGKACCSACQCDDSDCGLLLVQPVSYV